MFQDFSLFWIAPQSVVSSTIVTLSSTKSMATMTMVMVVVEDGYGANQLQLNGYQGVQFEGEQICPKRQRSDTSSADDNINDICTNSAQDERTTYKLGKTISIHLGCRLLRFVERPLSFQGYTI